MKSTRDVVKAYMDAMCKPDFEAAFAMFAPDGNYTIIGSSPVSKTFHGKEAITKELGGLLATGFKSPPQLVCDELIVEGDRGVALAHGVAEATYGTYKQDHYAFVFRVKDGMIADKVEFLDPSQLDIAVFGRKWAGPAAA
jgi:ketosteroid isomerase-like protein